MKCVRLVCMLRQQFRIGPECRRERKDRRSRTPKSCLGQKDRPVKTPESRLERKAWHVGTPESRLERKDRPARLQKGRRPGRLESSVKLRGPNEN